MVRANKSGVEKQKNFFYRGVIFLGEFSHCDYNFFEEIGKIRLIV